jgi:hypothetical protein
MIIAKEAMAKVAREMLRFPPRNSSEAEGIARSKVFCGAPVGVITDIWNRIEANLDPHAQPKHLLLSLVFIKVYSTEEAHCCIVVGWPDPKTHQKWM